MISKSDEPKSERHEHITIITYTKKVDLFLRASEKHLISKKPYVDQ